MRQTYDVAKRHHDKRGWDYWVAVPTLRMDRETYLAELHRCKVDGGWYARAWNGEPGGFAFREQSECIAWIGSMPDDVRGIPPEDAGATAPSSRPTTRDTVRADMARRQADWISRPGGAPAELEAPAVDVGGPEDPPTCWQDQRVWAMRRAELVVEALPTWTLEAEKWEHIREATHGSGARIRARWDATTRRLEWSPDWPYFEAAGGGRHTFTPALHDGRPSRDGIPARSSSWSVSTDPSRAPASIARDLERRLLADVLAAWPAALEWKTENDADTRAALELAERIRALDESGREPRDRRTSSGGDVSFSVRVAGLNWYGDVGMGGRHVNLHRVYVDGNDDGPVFLRALELLSRRLAAPAAPATLEPADAPAALQPPEDPPAAPAPVVETLAPAPAPKPKARRTARTVRKPKAKTAPDPSDRPERGSVYNLSALVNGGTWAAARVSD